MCLPCSAAFVRILLSLSLFLFSYLCSVFQASKKNDCKQSAWAKGEQQQQQHLEPVQASATAFLLPAASTSSQLLPACTLLPLCLFHSFAAFCVPSACVARGCAWQIYQMLPTYIYIYPYLTSPPLPMPLPRLWLPALLSLCASKLH